MTLKVTGTQIHPKNPCHYGSSLLENLGELKINPSLGTLVILNPSKITTYQGGEI